VKHKCLLLILIPVIPLIAELSSFAQEQKPDKDFTVDCATVQATTSCKSYNELIRAKDKYLLGQMSYQPFVCFVQDSDQFLVVTTKHPPTDNFRVAKDGISKIPGVEFLVTFKEGVQDSFRFIAGQWSKMTIADDIQFSFDTEPASDTELSIDQSEIEASYQFKNLYHTTTSYTLKIRRSTKRFVQSYDFPEPPTPAKKGEAPPTPSTTRAGDTGYCASFE
jgi:hypothetical protein